jgi:hypothetical protein
VKFFWTAAPMTAQDPRKGEPSSASMRNGFRTQPARLVRGSSRRIMSLRFRPAYIRVINRRARSCAVICPAVPEPRLKAHQRERVPASLPVDGAPGARTVLAVKGPLRRAKQRRALDCCAPFRPDRFRDGRLRREHFTGLHHTSETKGRLSLPWRKPACFKNPSDPVGLDRVAPYQK